MSHHCQDDTIQFAVRLIELLQQTRTTSTYKYAVLLAIMDLCLEGRAKHDGDRDSLTTREVTEKVIELYWSHCEPFKGSTTKVLKQNTGGQAEILTHIKLFKEKHGDVLPNLRTRTPRDYESFVDAVEWTLICKPLPKLQRLGGRVESLIYSITWDDNVKRGVVSAYQKHNKSGFDNLVRLQPGVAEKLIVLSDLLRPLLYREWAFKVAQMNKDITSEAVLEEFLFGASRVDLSPVNKGLKELQKGRCFYCGKPLGTLVEIDHFIPWSRYRDNGLHNLVAADKSCNGKKKNFLAAPEHVERWLQRNQADSETARYLSSLSNELPWEAHGEHTHHVAKTFYLRLKAHRSLWKEDAVFVSADHQQLSAIFSKYDAA
ncbi:MAG: HNH endonuclease [Myxococcota bacterium]|jgi:hypothetical protein|nr:HNH endonuclease [Myxococcota bacterium]